VGTDSSTLTLQPYPKVIMAFLGLKNLYNILFV
jgi:hypothetical protein